MYSHIHYGSSGPVGRKLSSLVTFWKSVKEKEPVSLAPSWLRGSEANEWFDKLTMNGDIY